MKLKLDTTKSKSQYQKVNVYNARNVSEPRDILTLVYVDEEDGKKYTIAELIENLYAENKKLKNEIKTMKQDFDDFKTKNNETEKLNIELIEALRKETREKGVL